MVYVNSKKYACESCIKGHRSSSCHHSDRPLFEIKKKGRPVSQCTSCRELRQSKKLHSKCTCDHRPQGSQVPVQPVSSNSTSKTKRFIPIIPSLPNGLKDALSSGDNSSPADARQRVDSLLNPCTCKSLWKCKCQAIAKKTNAIPHSAHNTVTGLNALADAAATMQSCCSTLPVSSSLPEVPPTTGRKSARPRSPPSSHHGPNKRQRQEKSLSGHVTSSNLDLPPLLYDSASLVADASSNSSGTLPDFGFMAPPMSQITSLAGSGCTCGVQCACPGCTEHRGRGQANPDRRSCADGCGTCIDHSLGMSLPQTGGAASSSFMASGLTDLDDSASVFGPSANPSTSSKESILDKFFARAAALPLPPQHRRMSIDPMDTSVYITATGIPQVNLPKLECCGGQCTCPDGQCSCQENCVGCGSTDEQEARPWEESVERGLPLFEEVSPQRVVRSCCAGGA
ncbi:hypothetical protein CPB83DRAFT_802372 [Crepidotus variabilis]|uniref:Copper-fist domain-containing protein n=1 Tax=Crepidotus variabilis TaxID=179855 RepID=A0A9P6ET99_9AGAR|nr:hypothetical protein CPB83DRAFT_802372 [Crepidotus variabilis]